MRVTYPRVLRVVKTRQATHSVLNHLIEYVQDLEKVGLLEEREMLHLHEAVQEDLKRLLRNPPLLKTPKISEMSLHPMWGALPSPLQESLATSTKEIMKVQGATLYREGSIPNGIWLISSGVVKWTNKSNKYSLHPTFSHGSTLGLYEALTGKPYICDIATDSVVLCFFVETEKIVSMLTSEPSIEDFLSQESAIVLTKFLLPQIFEKKTIQELRALVAERSEMNIYIREEIIEIPHHSIGLLLEGYAKSLNAQELIASPAPLLPSHRGASSRNLETSGTRQTSFSYQESYVADSRARVIIFDTAAFEADAVLLRRSSSSVWHPFHHLRLSMNREHKGLMSWREQFYKTKQDKENQVGVGGQLKSLATRAMQLSIFGSLICAYVYS